MRKSNELGNSGIKDEGRRTRDEKKLRRAEAKVKGKRLKVNTEGKKNKRQNLVTIALFVLLDCILLIWP